MMLTLYSLHQCCCVEFFCDIYIYTFTYNMCQDVILIVISLKIIHMSLV